MRRVYRAERSNGCGFAIRDDEVRPVRGSDSSDSSSELTTEFRRTIEESFIRALRDGNASVSFGVHESIFTDEFRRRRRERRHPIDDGGTGPRGTRWRVPEGWRRTSSDLITFPDLNRFSEQISEQHREELRNVRSEFDGRLAPTFVRRQDIVDEE